MDTKEIIKWAAIAIGGWWLLSKLQEPGGLLAGAREPGLAIQPAPTAPPRIMEPLPHQAPLPGQPAPQPAPAAVLPKVLNDMMVAAGSGSGLSFDQWNYYYSQATGNPGPSPESLGVDRSTLPASMSLSDWASMAGSGVSLSGLPGMGGLFQALRGWTQ